MKDLSRSGRVLPGPGGERSCIGDDTRGEPHSVFEKLLVPFMLLSFTTAVPSCGAQSANDRFELGLLPLLSSGH